MALPRWIGRALLWVSVCGVLALAAVRVAPRLGGEFALGCEERRGDACFRNGEFQEAETCWHRILTARPGLKSVRNKLAVICMRGGRYDEAGVLLREGLAQAPKESSFHYNLALLAYMQDDFDGALRSLATVQTINPHHGEVHYMKGVIFEAQGRHELAQQEFVRELNVDPATPEAWVRLGVLPPGSRIRSWVQK